MNIETTAIPGPLVVTPSRIGDERGFFSEVFRQDLFEKEAGPFTFVQDNHSVSSRRGVLRGLHFQRDPHAQGKLVRVARGAIFDVAVDVREGSKTFGRHVAVELTAENWKQLWVPPGFLHGFCTLSQEAEVLYKVTSFYNPECDGCVAHNDPDLGLLWPFARDELSLSPKDAHAPRLKDIAPPFPIGASST